MRARKTTEDNLIRVDFSMQGAIDLNETREEAIEQVQESNNCQGGVCSLNWSPVKPSKCKEAA